jgi:hypothetical protein
MLKALTAKRIFERYNPYSGKYENPLYNPSLTNVLFAGF